jgi:hypothetical protein
LSFGLTLPLAAVVVGEAAVVVGEAAVVVGEAAVVVDPVVVVAVDAASAENTPPTATATTIATARTPAPASRRSFLNIVQLLPSSDKSAGGLRPGRLLKDRVSTTATATTRARNLA